MFFEIGGLVFIEEVDVFEVSLGGGFEFFGKILMFWMVEGNGGCIEVMGEIVYDYCFRNFLL